MAIHAIRRARRLRSRHLRGTTATSTLAIVAGVSVVGIASFGQFGGAMRDNVQGRTEGQAIASAASNNRAFSDTQPGPSQFLELGSASAAASIDADVTNRLIDYLAGKGPRPAEIPANSEADTLLDKVKGAVETLIGNDETLREDLRQNLRANHDDVERILFTGVKKLDDVNEGLVQLIVESGGDLVAKLSAITNLAEDLENNHAGGREELQKVLQGESIGGSDEGSNQDANEDVTIEEPTTEEPTTEEPTTEEPTTEEPTTEESQSEGAEGGADDSAGGSSVEGDVDPEEAGKIILDAINANPAASEAAGELLEDPEMIDLVSAAASGEFDLDASDVIELVRNKPGIVTVLETLANDPSVLETIAGLIDPEYRPLLYIVAEKPGLVRQLGRLVQNASDAEMAAVLDIVERVQNGSFDAAALLDYLPLLGNQELLDFLKEVVDSDAVVSLAGHYGGPYAEVAARVLRDNPALLDEVGAFIGTATPAEMTLLENVLHNGLGFSELSQLLANPRTYAIAEALWNSDARGAIVEVSPWYVKLGASLLGDRALPFARWASSKINAVKSLWELGFDGFLTRVTGRECDGVFNMCRVKQGGGLVAAGVKKVGGWIGGLFGGGDDEPAKAVGTTAGKSNESPARGEHGTTSTVGTREAAAHTVGANLPPVLGYTPAFPGLLERQMMRIAAKRAAETE